MACGKSLNIAGQQNWCTAVFSYLYIEAGICYHRDEDIYMRYNYEIMEEWVAEDDDNEPKEVRQQCLKENKMQGGLIQEKMMDKSVRQQMEERIISFQPANSYQAEALHIARKTLAVWQAFPDANLYQQVCCFF